MRSRLPTITTSLLSLVISTAALTFTDQLPACWQTCVEKRSPKCDSTDLDCLCHVAATPSLLPTLLACVRKRCDTEYHPEFLTAPLQTIQIACDGTKNKISSEAVSKAESAAESLYSAAVRAERASLERSTGVRTGVSRATVTARSSLESASVRKTGLVTTSSITTTSASLSSPLASVGDTTESPTVSNLLTTSSVVSTLGSSTSTSTAHDSGNGGGTPLDIGQQGAGVTARAGSLLGLAIAFSFAVFF